MRVLAIAIVIVAMSGCAALKGFALNALSPSKGGINTEIVLGDKEQTLGTNQEVKATNVGKVVGVNDNSLDIARATGVVVTNNSFPMWAVGLLIILAALVGWLAPRPALWKRIIKRKDTNAIQNNL